RPRLQHEGRERDLCTAGRVERQGERIELDGGTLRIPGSALDEGGGNEGIRSGQQGPLSERSGNLAGRTERFPLHLGFQPLRYEPGLSLSLDGSQHSSG